MTPRKQLFRHDPDSGVYGDCHRTAIACLLDLEPDQVPHFGEHYTDSDTFQRAEQEWLASRGLTTVNAAFTELREAMNFLRVSNPGIYCLLGGKSANGCGHSVIACDGEIIWDPALDDAGIVAPFDEDGLYWLTFLVPASMRRTA